MITDYLIEQNLGDFLKSRFVVPVSFPRLKFDEGLFLPDFVIEDSKLIIEYDGPRHYTQSSTVIRDYKKQEVYTKYGYSIINIPYFVQLSEDVIDNLFGRYSSYMHSMEAFNSYPHGFISPKVLLPSDFCSLGVKRFENELSDTFKYIANDIITSLNDKVNSKRTKHEVFPLSMI